MACWYREAGTVSITGLWRQCGADNTLLKSKHTCSGDLPCCGCGFYALMTSFR
jgi:hypothetical protein